MKKNTKTTVKNPNKLEVLIFKFRVWLANLLIRWAFKIRPKGVNELLQSMQDSIMYGIGVTRLIGTLVEIFHDENGIIWPRSVAPFDVHLVHIEDPGTESWAKKTYEKLTDAGIEILWDDRENVSAGEKFADADLIGIPIRLVVSSKIGEGKVEWKRRGSNETEMFVVDETIKKILRSRSE